jgi:Cyclic nucleotide-binding domain
MTTYDIILLLPLLAAALLVAGFLCRDQMWLRTWAIFGNLVFILYFALVADVPLWTAVIAAALIVAVNLYMMNKVLADRRAFALTGEEMMLFARLPGLTPGQFKLLLAEATWHESRVPERLTVTGIMPEALHFLLEGRAEVEREGKRFDIGPNCFVGELAFLRGQPATATVHTKVGALRVSWPPEKLRALMKTNDGISRAMSALLSGDLAEKIVRTGLASKV